MGLLVRTYVFFQEFCTQIGVCLDTLAELNCCSPMQKSLEDCLAPSFDVMVIVFGTDEDLK